MTALPDPPDSSLEQLLATPRQEALDLSAIRRVVERIRARNVELERRYRELTAAHQVLEQSRNHYAALYDLAPVAYAVLDRKGHILQMNLAATKLPGLERERSAGFGLGTLLAPGGSWLLLSTLTRVLDTGVTETLEVGRAADQAPAPELRLVINRTPPQAAADAPVCLIALFDNVEHQRLTLQLQERERELVQLTQHDPLTALPNRILFTDRLAQTLRQAHRQQRHAALLFLDLDGFKTINDTLGHAVGDRVLREAGHRIRTQVREDDTVARFGGDEFTLVLGSLERGEDAAVVAEKLLQAFKLPIDVDGRPLYISATIGISIYPQDGTEVDTLIRHADIAMHQAKEQGQNSFRYYNKDMTTQVVALASLETGLRQALARGEFALYYQPQHDLATGAINGIEALLRWRHPMRGLLGPEAFMTVAESSGLIVPIGTWVVRTAASQLRSWREVGLLTTATMWVNLSNREIRTANLAARIAATIAGVALEPGSLAVEICDIKTLADSASATENIRRLVDLGIEVAIDDFGSGHSSLASLRRLAVRALKIDGSFVAGLPGSAHDEGIVRAIVFLGRTLGLRVVATGIETQEQAVSLRATGCEIGQGYLFSRPLPAEEFEAYCRSLPADEVPPRPEPEYPVPGDTEGS